MEALAYDYIYAENRALVFLALFVGILVGLLPVFSTGPIKRSAYFCLNAAVGFSLSMTGFIWTALQALATSGLIWLGVCAELFAFLAAGVAFSTLAKGRAVDGFGKKRYAILAFVPLLNFWLLFKPSRDQTQTVRSASASIIVCGVLLAAASKGVQTAADDAVAKNYATPELNSALFQGEVRARGTRFIIDQLVEQFQGTLPKKYSDGLTTLVSVGSTEDTFIYNYQVDSNFEGPLPYESIEYTTSGNCDPNAGVRKFLDVGVKVEHSYVNRSGKFIGSFVVSQSDCE